MKVILRFLFIILCIASLECGKNIDSTNQNDNMNSTITVTDSLNRQVVINKNIKRAAISNAYNAELINAIGALDKVIGVDYYIYQDQDGFGHRFKEENLIGSTSKELNYEKIIQLNPDVLIIPANAGWEDAEKKLKPFNIPVVVCNAYYTDQFAKNVDLLGTVFGEEKKAKEFKEYFTKIASAN